MHRAPQQGGDNWCQDANCHHDSFQLWCCEHRLFVASMDFLQALHSIILRRYAWTKLTLTYLSGCTLHNTFIKIGIVRNHRELESWTTTNNPTPQFKFQRLDWFYFQTHVCMGMRACPKFIWMTSQQRKQQYNRVEFVAAHISLFVKHWIASRLGRVPFFDGTWDCELSSTGGTKYWNEATTTRRL